MEVEVVDVNSSDVPSVSTITDGTQWIVLHTSAGAVKIRPEMLLSLVGDIIQYLSELPVSPSNSSDSLTYVDAIKDRVSALEDLLDSATDADSVVSKLMEVLSAMENFPEGVQILTELNNRYTKAEVDNGFVDIYGSNNYVFANNSGSGNAYIGTNSRFVAGNPTFFVIGFSDTAGYLPTGPATLNLNSTGVLPLKAEDGTDLESGQIQARSYLVMADDAAYYIQGVRAASYSISQSDSIFDQKIYLQNITSDALVTTTTGDVIFRNTTGAPIILTPNGASVRINGSTAAFAVPSGSFCFLKRGVDLDNTKFFAFIVRPTDPNAAIFWGQILGTITDQADLVAYIAAQDATNLVAAKAYADSLVVGLWDDRGTFDASGGAYPNAGGSGTSGAIKKGDIWTINGPGTLPTGQVVALGATVRALIDSPGNTQANWAIQGNNIGYVVENAANKADMIGNESSTTKYAHIKGIVDWSAINLEAKISRAYIAGNVTITDTAPESFLYINDSSSTSYTITAGTASGKTIKLDGDVGGFITVFPKTSVLIVKHVNGSVYEYETFKNHRSYSNQYITAAGSANTITFDAPNSYQAAYVVGESWDIRITTTNTGSANINRNSLGNKVIRSRNGVVLYAGALIANTIYRFTYNGTYFVVDVATPDYVISQYTTSGSANTQSFSTVAATGLQTGECWLLKAGLTNSGAMTLQRDSLGAKAVVKQNLTALSAGDWVANAFYWVVYNGTSYVITNSPATTPTLTTADVAPVGDTQYVTSAQKAKLAGLPDNIAWGAMGTLTSGTLDYPDSNLSSTSVLIPVYSGIGSNPGILSVVITDGVGATINSTNPLDDSGISVIIIY